MANNNSSEKEVNVLHSSEMLDMDEALNVKGGVKKELAQQQDCTCDCWIGNSNTHDPKKKISDKMSNEL